MAVAAAARMAMNPSILAKIGNFLKPAFANEAGKITARSIAERVGPDAFFGTMAALQTPGDAFDKATAFTTSTLGGAMGGAVAGGLGRKVGFGPNMLTEFGGGYAGDSVGMIVGDALMRGKDKLMGGEGLTGWERLSKEQQEQYANELEQQILAGYGLVGGPEARMIMAGNDDPYGLGVGVA